MTIRRFTLVMLVLAAIVAAVAVYFSTRSSRSNEAGRPDGALLRQPCRALGPQEIDALAGLAPDSPQLRLPILAKAGKSMFGPGDTEISYVLGSDGVSGCTYMSLEGDDWWFVVWEFGRIPPRTWQTETQRLASLGCSSTTAPALDTVAVYCPRWGLYVNQDDTVHRFSVRTGATDLNDDWHARTAPKLAELIVARLENGHLQPLPVPTQPPSGTHAVWKES
jgi:hypothetical protein